MKSPAFQFYPKDFLSDINVRTMTWDQKGAYIELLCFCWLEDGVPKDLIERWFNGGSTVLEPVLKCFYEKDGKYQHKRLDLERQKQLEWSEKSKIGGERSGKSRREHPVKRRNKISNEPPLNQRRTKGEPKGNSSSSSSSSSSTSSGDIDESYITPPTSPDQIDIRLTQLLIDLILENNPKAKVSTLTESQQRKWIGECRILREKYNRTPAEIEQVIRWCQADDFWKGNIQSMDKLSKQFDRLWLKAHGAPSKGVNLDGIKEFGKRHGVLFNEEK